MAFDIYKRKFVDQPFPRKHVKSFDTIDQVMEFLGLDQNQAIAALEGEEVPQMNAKDKIYTVELNLPFLGEGNTHQEIAEKLKSNKHAVEVMFERGVKKLYKTGRLKPFLESIQALRSHQYKEVVYSEKITIKI